MLPLPEIKKIPLPIPLLLPSIFWIAGLLCGFIYFSQWVIDYYFRLLIPIIILFIAFLFLTKSYLRLFLLVILVFILAFFRVGISQYKPANHISNLWDEKNQITQPIVLRITSQPRLRSGQYGDYYRVTGNFKEIAGHKVTGRVIITFPESFYSGQIEQLIVGNYLQATATISRYRDASGFHKAPVSYFRSSQIPDANASPVSLVTALDARNYHPPYKHSTSTYFQHFRYQYSRTITKIHSFIVDRIDSRVSTKHSPFIKAILLGDRTDMQEEREILIKAGMAHLLAISGLHLTIITLVILTIFRIIAIRRTPAYIMMIIIILIYAELCGWTASVSRAAVMITLYLMTKILQRKPSPNNILLGSLIIITAFNPAQLFSIGLQYSIISVFVIINIYGFISPITLQLVSANRSLKKSQFLGWIVKHLLEIVILSFCIGLFLTPLTLYYFHQFSMNGVIANTIGIPLITLIIPLSIVIILLPEIPLFTIVYPQSLEFLMTIMDRWSQLTSTFPLFFNFIPFSAVQTLILYLFLLGLFMKIKESIKVKKNVNIRDKVPINAVSQREKTRKRTINVLHYSLLFSLFFFTLLPSYIRQNDLLKVMMFDVGHGDLLLIETPAAEKILVDTGPVVHNRGHIRTSALPYFQQQGIRKLDWIILTHPHDDHYGGFQWIMDNLEVANIMLTEHFSASPIWNVLQEGINIDKTNIYVIQDTTHIPNISLKNKIIHPDILYRSDNDNNMSLVLRIAFGNFSILLTGDIESDAEVYLVRNYSSYLSSRFLKVAHHGSNTSTIELFLMKVNPDYTLISSAIEGRHNLPHNEVIGRLYREEADNIFITGIDGHIQIKTDGITATIITYPDKRRIAVAF